MNVMLLAAGEGTRLRPFTQTLPKPAIPFLSVPLACYPLALMERIKIDKLVVNTYHLPDEIRKLFERVSRCWNELVFSSEEGELLGSGGGIHNAFKHLKGRGDFFVMNADEVILPHQSGLLEEMISFHRWHKGIATLLTIEHPEVGQKFGGAWLSEGSKIKLFSKTNPGAEAPRGLHFTGVLLLSEKIASYFKPQVTVENILYETLTEAMKAGEEVHAFEAQAEWFETGNPADFLHATETCLQSLQANLKERPFWQEYLIQTIRLNSLQKYVVEKDWAQLSDLQALVQKIRKAN
ncbi:MAG: NDP-sugar synthase [Pseudobdellovibrionaceae bacterium]